MPAGHAGRLVWEPRSNAGRNADVPPLSPRTDRYYSAESVDRAGRSRCGGFAWLTRRNARTAWTLAFIQRHTVDDHLSSGLSAAEPGPSRETEGLGRHDASPRASRKANQRETAKLLSVAASVSSE